MLKPIILLTYRRRCARVVIVVFNKTYKGQSYEVIVDAEDAHFLQESRYFLIKQGKSKLRVYSPVFGYLHRAITQCPKESTVDHIDGNPLNNTRTNLRVCSLYENTRNTSKRGKNTTSQYKGVVYDKRPGALKKRWVAQIKINYKTKKLGRFLTEEEAAKCYNEAALALWGRFASLNVVKG